VDTIHHRYHKNLVKLLKRERLARGLSQSEVASRLQKHHQSWLSGVERGYRRVDFVEFILIAEAIGLDPIEVLLEIYGK